MYKSVLSQRTNAALGNSMAGMPGLQVELDRCEEFQHLVICGLPKCGTTLPLTLLDNHTKLSVFPEELRFMDSGCQNMRNQDALVKLLQNYNTRQLQTGVAWLDEYREHMGTGYGLRDYSNLEFDVFAASLTRAFELAVNAEQRYFACFLALELARNNQKSMMTDKSTLVSKSPNYELYMFSWQRMLCNRVKFLWCVRSPFEHYLSLKNTAEQLGQQPMAVELFCQWVKGRYDLLPDQDDSVFVLRYEDLLQNTLSAVKQIADFINVKFQPCLTQPSKNGSPWAGNSSRGIVQEGIYNNPELAKQQLDSHTLITIETQLKGVLRRFNYQ